MLEVNELCYLSCLTKFLSSLFRNFYLKCKDTKLHQFYTNFPFHYPSKLFESQSRSSHPEVLLGKGVLKICNKCTGDHPCRSAISIKLLCNFIEIALRHGCSPVNLLHIFRIYLLLRKPLDGYFLQKPFYVFKGYINEALAGKKVIFGKHNLHRQKKKDIKKKYIKDV